MIKKIISAFFTRGLVAAINLAVLLISSKQLGAGIVGQIGLLILNVAIIQIVNEIYTGYSLVYFIAKFSLRKVYVTGLLWTPLCIAALSLLFFCINIGREFWLHTALLSLMATLGSFHSVIILARQRMAAYNFLVFLQPAVLLITLCVSVFICGNRSVDSYLLALYLSFFLALIISAAYVLRLISKEKESPASFSAREIMKNGFINQAGNLAHTLSNRISFYLIGSTVLIGVFSRASSLIESVWLIGASITPLVLTRVANQHDKELSSRMAFLLSKISMLLSLLSVLVILCVPQSFFVFLLGPDFSDVKALMLSLSPGIVFIGFSTVLSHYFSGVGEQKVQLLANMLGLLVTVCTAPLLIARYGLTGACYSASLSYFVQALVVTWLFMRRSDFKFRALFSFKEDLELLKK